MKYFISTNASFLIFFFWRIRIFSDFKLHNQEARSNGQSTLITNASAPKQIGNTECEYYVLSYMRDIVGVGIDKLQMKKSYTPDNLERVREEWVLYVQTFIECEY